MKKSKKIIVKKLITALLSLLLVAMAAAVGYLTFCNVTGRIAFIGNRAAVKILTPSMEPTIPAGTYIFAQKVEPEDIQVGDVILFISRDPAIYGKINTHRVVAVYQDDSGLSFVTKGDNNPVNDAKPVPAGDVVGRYMGNSGALTAFAGFFSNPVVFFLCIIVPAGVLVVSSMTDVVKKAREIRMDRLVEEEIRRMEADAENQKESDGESDGHVSKICTAQKNQKM